MSSRVIAAVVLGGVALGIAARLVDDVAPRWVGDAAAIWVLAGFFVGTLSTSRREGVRLGVTCLFTACGAYYLWRVWVDDRIWADFFLSVGLFWLVASLLVGAAAGYVGAASRRDRWLWGVPAGAFIGEALAIWILERGVVQIGIELGMGLLLFLVARIDLRRAAAVAVVVALTVALVGVGYRLALGARKALRRAAPSPVAQIKEGPPFGGRPLFARDP